MARVRGRGEESLPRRGRAGHPAAELVAVGGEPARDERGLDRSRPGQHRQRRARPRARAARARGRGRRRPACRRRRRATTERPAAACAARAGARRSSECSSQTTSLRRRDAERGQQRTRAPGVLAGDHVGAARSASRTRSVTSPRLPIGVGQTVSSGERTTYPRLRCRPDVAAGDEKKPRYRTYRAAGAEAAEGDPIAERARARAAAAAPPQPLRSRATRRSSCCPSRARAPPRRPSTAPPGGRAGASRASAGCSAVARSARAAARRLGRLRLLAAAGLDAARRTTA